MLSRTDLDLSDRLQLSREYRGRGGECFVRSGQQRIDLEILLPDDVADLLGILHQDASLLVSEGLKAFLDDDMAAAQAVLDSKEEFNHKTDRIRLHLAHKLSAGDHAMLLVYCMGSDHLENLKRLHTLTRRIANTLLDIHEGQALPSIAEPLPVRAEQAAVPENM